MPVAGLVMGRVEKDPAHSLDLTSFLAMECQLVSFERQQEVDAKYVTPEILEGRG